MLKSPKNVFIGLSGGVDSSVSAHLLKQQGFQVVGVYMKNWTQDVGGVPCSWNDDYLATKRLAHHLGIDLLVVDFQKEYSQLVVDYMIDAFKRGLTPNPDIRCNQEIKFKLFLETCLKNQADYIATGHYAQIKDGRLMRARDPAKDQTYFLYSIDRDCLNKVIFPVGHLKKQTVRQLALKAGLPTALRAESMGLCFVGQVSLEDFLRQYVETEPGPILDDQREVIGRHRGAIFYTVGQRKGLGIGGRSLPYYVTGKDMSKNEVYASQNLNHPDLVTDRFSLKQPHLLIDKLDLNKQFQVRLRHQAQLMPARITRLTEDRLDLQLSQTAATTAPGQSVVIYDDQLVIGGGII